MCTSILICIYSIIIILYFKTSFILLKCAIFSLIFKKCLGFSRIFLSVLTILLHKMAGRLQIVCSISSLPFPL